MLSLTGPMVQMILVLCWSGCPPARMWDIFYGRVCSLMVKAMCMCKGDTLNQQGIIALRGCCCVQNLAPGFECIQNSASHVKGRTILGMCMHRSFVSVRD
jgi:hypothetical protein